MLVGLGLMAVPLLAAILTALLQMRVLADTGQRIIVEGVTAARASQALFAQIASLERTARLFNVLNDAKLLDLYRSEDERLTSTREQLSSHARADTRTTLDELGRLQASTRYVVLSTAASPGARATADLSERFTQLSVLVEQVAQQSNAEVDTEVAALEAQTLRARQQLLWESALLVPLALIAVLVLTIGVGRPLRQLDRTRKAARTRPQNGNPAHSSPRTISGVTPATRWTGRPDILERKGPNLAPFFPGSCSKQPSDEQRGDTRGRWGWGR